MKYLITGITGFAGPHLANLLLNKGHEVFGLIRHSNGRETDLLDVISESNLNKISFLYGDLLDFDAIRNIFKEHVFDGVFHLAAQSHPPTSFKRPMYTFHTNAWASINLIETVIKENNKCRFMLCSTSEVYGNVQSKEPFNEDTPIAPVNPYGSSKAAADLYMQERIKNGFINGYITRAFSHTGPRRGKNFSISSDAYQIANMLVNPSQKKELLIGNLETIRVVMDVRDCVKAYYDLMISNTHEYVFNICGNVPHKMKYYTDTLVEISELKNIEYKIHKPYYRDIDIDYQFGNSDRLKKVTGWSMSYNIYDTLRDLLIYWKTKIDIRSD